MFKKVLYPTDFSDYSNQVLQGIFELKNVGTKEIIALHVIDKRIFSEFPEVTIDVLNAMKSSAEENMDKISTELEKHGFKVDVRIEVGIPFSQIVGIAKTEAVSMIVMGSHGKSLVEEMLLGSTTENVLRHSSVPILIEKFEINKDGNNLKLNRRHGNPFRKILYPTDFSACAKGALPYLKHLANSGTEDIILLHVQDTSDISQEILDKLPEFENIDSGRLNELEAELKSSGIKNVEAILKDGDPFEEIEKVAEEKGVSMIAIGSHGRSAVREFLLGSVSGKILRRSTQPIFVVRAK